MRKTINVSYPFTVVMVVLLWLFSVPVHAGIYKWKDDRGKVHFTDDKSKIPLKYRDQIKRFKGVAEPEPVEEPSKEEEETVAAPEPEAVESQKPEKKPEKDTRDPKLVAILKETISFLKDENRKHQRLLDFVKPDVQNGRYYILPIRKGVGKKEQMIDKLDGFKLASLKRARRFLKSSVFKDKQEKIGGDDYLQRIQDLKRRMEIEIRTKKKIIERLQTDLKPGGK